MKIRIHRYILLWPHHVFTSCRKLIPMKMKNVTRNPIPNATKGKEGRGERGGRQIERQDIV
jgi:hypothetical protein